MDLSSKNLYMVLSTEPPFLFLHVPKTGGSSIEETLYSYTTWGFHTITHGVVLQYKHWLNKDLFDSLFKFAFVRNPWDLQVSCYLYYVVQNNIDMTFEEYIKWKFTGNILDMESRLPKEDPNVNIEWLRSCFYVHRTPQNYFLIDEAGNYLVNYIGSFEKIQDHYDNICQNIGIETSTLSHLNYSHHRDRSITFQEYYTPETKKLVEERYSMDIKTFGYSFDQGFPNSNLMGLTDDKNDSIQKRGYKTPPNFYFTFGDLPYGLNQVASFNFYKEEDEIQKEKQEFYKSKHYRRLDFLRTNVERINSNIESLETDIMLNHGDLTIFNKNKDEILSLLDKKLKYQFEIGKLESFIGELESSQDK